MMRKSPVRRPLNILEEDGPLPGVITPLSPWMWLHGVSGTFPVLQTKHHDVPGTLYGLHCSSVIFLSGS